MRPVQLADVEMAARVLMLSPPEARAVVMRNLIAETVQAEAYRQLHGIPHPQFCVGSLLSRAMRFQAAPRPAAFDADTLHAYGAVFAALSAYQSL